MTTQANFFQAITETVLLKVFNIPTKAAPTGTEDLLKTATTGFWNYTEETGEADITSFTGLL